MFNAISLFSGCGGCCLGLKQADFDIKLAVDINRDACETYATNLGSEEILQLDLTNIAPEEILKQSQLNPFEIDLIVAGPPCQGFSSAGTKSWHDPRNILFRKAVEIIIKLQPTWFILENVEGVLTSKDGFYMIEAIARFLDAGYWVRVQKIYMEKYGLPQKRKRVFLVGNLAECQFDFPSGIYDNNPQLSLFDKYPQLSILDAIGDLPSPQTTVNFPNNSGIFYDKLPHCDYQTQLRQTEYKPLFHHQIKQINSISQERINLLTPGGTMKDLPVNLQHPSYNKRAFRRVKDGMPTEKRGGAPNGLKRLLPDEPSLTITSTSVNEFVHPVQNRLLTLRECARIQSFPDWYNFTGSFSSISTQIGNAIPPLFMKLLATHIRSFASWKPRKNSQGRWLGIDVTKSSGKSPKLAKMLAEIEHKTYPYAR